MFLVMLGGLIVGLYDSNIPFLAVGIVAVVILYCWCSGMVS